VINLTDNSELSIFIFDSNEIDDIIESDWDLLSSNAMVNNPFYECWNLIPAVKCMDLNGDVKIIVTYRDNKIVSLFPIVIRSFIFWKLIKLWSHKHCYEATPLIISTNDFHQTLKVISHHYKSLFVLIDLHSATILGDFKKAISTNYERAFIENSNELRGFIDSHVGKKKREKNRLIRRLNDDFTLAYIEHKDAMRGMKDYCLLEHKGWKAFQEGSIQSSELISKYYEQLAIYAEQECTFEFQILTANDKIIAMGVRIVSGSNYYEIKTSFDEAYRKYAPGKVLEYMNLESLSQRKAVAIDSCTHHHNILINSIWPNKKILLRSFIFQNNFTSQACKLLYTLKKRLTNTFSANLQN
jgi:hypothetical protein